MSAVPNFSSWIPPRGGAPLGELERLRVENARLRRLVLPTRMERTWDAALNGFMGTVIGLLVAVAMLWAQLQ